MSSADRVRARRGHRRRRILRNQLDRPRANFAPICVSQQLRPGDNWYAYTYNVNGREVKSYWLDRQGIDRGEPSKAVYALHCLVGHHGIFSLTPIWLLSVAGA